MNHLPLVYNSDYQKVEFRRGLTDRQKEWVRHRDRKPHFPVLDEQGRLIDLEIEEKGQVHHIHMINYFEKFRPETDPNHPLNLFYIGNTAHTAIHRDWILPLKEEYEAYKDKYTLTEYIQLETWTGKRVFWLQRFDDTLTAMALCNSIYYLDDVPFKEKYVDDVLELYDSLDKDFIQRYTELKQFYGLCLE